MVLITKTTIVNAIAIENAADSDNNNDEKQKITLRIPTVAQIQSIKCSRTIRMRPTSCDGVEWGSDDGSETKNDGVQLRFFKMLMTVIMVMMVVYVLVVLSMTKIMIVMMVIVVMIIVMMVMTSVRMVAMCIVKVTIGSLIVMFVMTTLSYFSSRAKQCSSQPYRTTYALKHQPKRGQGKWSANVTCWENKSLSTKRRHRAAEESKGAKCTKCHR